MGRSFAGEKTPAKAAILLTLEEDQRGRNVTVFGRPHPRPLSEREG